MKPVRLAAVAVVVGAGILTGLLLRGGHSNPVVAHVAAETITRDQLEAAVDHFRKDAKQEGTPFPDEYTARFRAFRNRLLGVLVYRVELSQAARRLGVSVSRAQVLRRLNGSSQSGEGSEQGSDQFEYDTVKAQMLYERIYAGVTRHITAPTTAQLSARKNAAMKRYVDRLERETQVRYEPGYAPGP
jgi:outer membrane murein-binding lipoprotein Lpp